MQESLSSVSFHQKWRESTVCSAHGNKRIAVCWNGVAPALAPNVAALYLTYGVGSPILYEDSDAYVNERAEVKKGVSLLMGMPADDQELRIPYLAVAEDIPSWIELLETVRKISPVLTRRSMKSNSLGL